MASSFTAYFHHDWSVLLKVISAYICGSKGDEWGWGNEQFPIEQATTAHRYT